MYHGRIVGTGRFLPELAVSNEDLSKVVETSDEWIYSRTGIKERRIAADVTVSEMATNASLNALKKANVDPKEIDMIITATVSSDYSMPSIACMVQGNLGAENAFCFDLNAACSGFTYGLDVVNQFMATGRVKKAIVIGVERLSQVLNWEDRGTCVLFGDGAGAAVIEATEESDGVIDTLSKSIGSSWEALKSPVKQNDTPYYKQTSETFLTMDGRAVFQFACSKVPELLNEIFEKNNLTGDDIDLFVLHQANSRIIERIAKKMKQPIDKYFMNIHKYGNTSAATIPIALDELNEDGLLSGKTVAISGFGAGLTYGGSVIKFK